MLQQSNELSTAFIQLQSRLAAQKMPSTQAKQVLAHALIETLQNWCMQLFWMTVLCVINCCAEEDEKKPKRKHQEHPEFKKRIEDIEQKMLRHLTSPMISGPLRPVRKLSSRRVFSSRPPSPQLFDIAEEE
ncbi:uncharacterized protein CELE_E01G4.3 [Caenorhabditis elegans]|nr:Uncharacterized protein CELE_E01G4.3 [Caenorhabditis elegans]CAB05715.1 Uncharacterized protein CELE_E01G4.3 [Caenorhabditis elegans]|eukprot:NP_001254391.1 Uncharacterized protein CELE_E01G4.3 [Caenorhabditis elegans]